MRRRAMVGAAHARDAAKCRRNLIRQSAPPCRRGASAAGRARPMLPRRCREIFMRRRWRQVLLCYAHAAQLIAMFQRRAPSREFYADLPAPAMIDGAALREEPPTRTPR